MPRRNNFRKSIEILSNDLPGETAGPSTPLCSAQDDKFWWSAPPDQQVDGEMGDREKRAKRAAHALQPLHRFLVVEYAVLQPGDAARLPIADHVPHLALQYAKVGQYLRLKIRHM